MIVGRLDKRVVIQAPRETGALATGEPSIEWTNVAEIWASIEGLRGRELEAARAIEARADVRIVIRAWPGLSAAHRLYWLEGAQPHWFEIFDVDDKRYRHREMVLTCTEVEGRA